MMNPIKKYLTFLITVIFLIEAMVIPNVMADTTDDRGTRDRDTTASAYSESSADKAEAIMLLINTVVVIGFTAWDWHRIKDPCTKGSMNMGTKFITVAGAVVLAGLVYVMVQGRSQISKINESYNKTEEDLNAESISVIKDRKSELEKYRSTMEMAKNVTIGAMALYGLGIVLAIIDIYLYHLALAHPVYGPKTLEETAAEATCKEARLSDTSNAFKLVMGGILVALITGSALAFASIGKNKSSSDTNAAHKSPLGLSATVLLSIVMFAVVVLEATSDHIYGRPILFGVELAMMGRFFDYLQRAINRADDQIKVYTDMTNQINRYQSQITFNKTTRELQMQESISQLKTEQDAQAELKATCLNQKRSDPALISTDCKCMESQSCLGSTESSFQVNGFAMPNYWGNLVGEADQVMNNLAHRNFAKAGLQAASLNNNYAARLKKLKKHLESEMNKNAAKLGKSPFDFDKSTAEELAKMDANISKVLQDNGVAVSYPNGTPTDAVVAQSNMPDSTADHNMASEKSRLTNTPAGSNTTPETATQAATDPFSFEDENGAPAQPDNGLAQGVDTREVASLDQFEDVESVSQQNSESIFKLLSARYMKSAFPKLLEQE